MATLTLTDSISKRPMISVGNIEILLLCLCYVYVHVIILFIKTIFLLKFFLPLIAVIYLISWYFSIFLVWKSFFTILCICDLIFFLSVFPDFIYIFNILYTCKDALKDVLYCVLTCTYILLSYILQIFLFFLFVYI